MLKLASQEIFGLPSLQWVDDTSVKFPNHPISTHLSSSLAVPPKLADDYKWRTHDPTINWPRLSLIWADPLARELIEVGDWSTGEVNPDRHSSKRRRNRRNWISNAWWFQLYWSLVHD